MSSIDFLLSRRQQKMLAALLIDPCRQFGTNELVAVGGQGIGAGRNVTRSFEASGIVMKAARGYQVLYSINRQHPIYPDLRSICMKSFGLADVVAQELHSFRDRIDFAFIFGSIARGSDGPESDVDLLIVGNIDVFELGSALERLQGTLGRVIDLNLHTPSEWKRLASDRVMDAIMNGAKITVIGP
ncbi:MULTISPECIES: nucleotidyltransferase domain-containing protein [unclassified Rhizobium]|uniref:nucleotidyltransferase domain-containing protein n=1 Tax=unclassified Rhizobium TaxID=2613769 RepID=UPI001C8368E5|nr:MULTISPECIES: nucleotidyltransferase domain-containing protein [unclassified Rhizobium]MBX5167025.1 nucleotidyltransferase domain-containing protein [Rhizobium sp. NZLR4b]MBX5211172.1 nucleotidyltransferase domain-containing protein [Rhizobium sp. NZLR11]